MVCGRLATKRFSFVVYLDGIKDKRLNIEGDLPITNIFPDASPLFPEVDACADRISLLCIQPRTCLIKVFPISMKFGM